MAESVLAIQTLSPRQFALAIGVSESTMKRWVDAGLVNVSRTPGGHRRIPLAEAVRFIRERKMDVLRPELLGIPSLESRDVRPSEEVDADAFYELLLTSNAVRARALLLGAYLGGTSIAALCDGPVRTALSRLGVLWKDDARGIFYERRATLHCIEALNQIRLFVEVPDDAPQAVGSAPTGDPYVLGSQMSGLVLAETGFRETNLGPDVPLSTLAAAAEASGALLVWLSVSSPGARSHLQAEFSAFAARMDRAGARIVVGGRAAPRLASLMAGSSTILPSMQELADFGADLLVSSDPSTSSG